MQEKERIIQEDMEYIRQRIDHTKISGSRVDRIRLAGSTVLVSGATGLIGKYLVRFLVQHCGCRVLAVVRDSKKARRAWEDLGSRVRYICSDITELGEEDLAGERADYMIHAASVTSSRDFSAHPVKVIYTSTEGTRRMLEIARKHSVKGFVYLSTMEVYGAPKTDEKIGEFHGTDLDTMAVRSSYPEGKRLCESMCAAYFSEFQVPVRVLRLTQTFAPGVEYHDSRVFAEFARCVTEGKDIVLHTAGETRRSYLYLADACTAILTVLTKGADGEAYNGANESTYCSIREMAELVAAGCAEGKICVHVEPDKERQKELGYAPVLKMNLDTAKLRRLGWRPETDLLTMYKRMIISMRNCGE